jgi:three-Cys-motif partner protein
MTMGDVLLEPEDDGLPIRETGSWALEKLDYVRRYIGVFVSSMRSKPWRAINYIDLFCGPGKGKIGETGRIFLGSPLLALQAPQSFTRYFFSDIDEHNVSALQRRVEASPLRARVECQTGDANLLANRIIQRILDLDKTYMPGRWSSLNLAFLDPNSFQLKWQTMETLSKPYSMDLIIYYPQGPLSRSMRGLAETEYKNVTDEYLGDREWRNIYRQSQLDRRMRVHRTLMDYYKSKLAKLGYVEVFRDDEVHDEPLMRNAQKRAPLYRLLFASKHELGSKFWRDVTRHDVHGQRQLPFS